ncbi:MAG: type II toxin-antitoxin system HicB family antitoxin [Candidatus Contendobacter sp.]
MNEVFVMLDLSYSLTIEATDEPDYFGFYSPDLAGFSGIGHSVEDCIYKAKWGMKEHVGFLGELNLPIPDFNPDPKIIIQNEKKLAVA